MKIVHKKTKDVYANVLTKPVQGSQFVYERQCLTGWEMPFGLGPSDILMAGNVALCSGPKQ